MYNEYFGFSEAPFSIAPDPRYLFMSERHREALAHLLYGFRIDGGFVLLTGEVGTGKTTVCRCLLEQVPSDCDVAFILNPRLDTVELLATLCDELHIDRDEKPAGTKALIDRLNEHLLAANAAGRRTVLIVDEAQTLSNEALEQLRLLTNLETNKRKLLQIMLLGQPELRERLAQPDMRQLAQRIVARYHLEPLSRAEVGEYVAHRLAVAGCRRPLFPSAVVERLHRVSGGTPRLINLICDRALLGCFVEGKATVDAAVLEKAVREVAGSQPKGARMRSEAARIVATALGFTIVLSLASAYYRDADHNGNGTQPTTSIAATRLPDLPNQLSLKLAAGTGPGGPITWPAGSDPWLHEAHAVRALFQRWQLDVPPSRIEDACRSAEERNLVCLRRSDEFAVLRGMNAPAIVELRQDEGPTFYATLLSLGPDRAQLSIAGRVHEVSVDSLRRQWTGQYTLVWRRPAGWTRMLAPGARGPDVAWVVRQLDRWQGQNESDAASSSYTAELVQRVRAFQRMHGLQEDGMVGAMTMVRLTAMADASAPVLARQAH